MKNFFFYLFTVLIWGSSWIGIKMQLGTVEPMVSVSYRFALAAAILALWCRITRRRLNFGRNEQFFILLQGLCLFSINYILFYIAELHITSGLAAVVFSTILLMNVINGAIFLSTPIDLKVCVGGGLGLTGILLVFQPEIASFSIHSESLKGLLLSILATYSASLGNILSARNQKKGLPIIETNCLGMAYGAGFMLLLALVSGKDFTIVWNFQYIGSLLYLAIFASIVAFSCYLSLIGSIGADRAAYATLLFPLVALAISTIWEGYQWTIPALFGVFLILVGNLLMLGKKIARSQLIGNQSLPSCEYTKDRNS